MIQITIAFGLIAVTVFFMDRYFIMKLEQENEMLRRTIRDREDDIRFLNYKNIMCSSNAFKAKTTLPKGTMKYLKIALKTTHPDNGGSAEEFIECNKIYKSLCKNFKEGN